MTPIPATKLAPCKGCGRGILWAQNMANGKMIPLDPGAIVYELTSAPEGDATCARAEPRFKVSHFATCTAANQFSGKNRKGGNDEHGSSNGEPG